MLSGSCTRRNEPIKLYEVVPLQQSQRSKDTALLDQKTQTHRLRKRQVHSPCNRRPNQVVPRISMGMVVAPRVAMSFRNPFITDFIYQASDEVIDANPLVTQVFKDHTDTLTHEVDARGYGYYAGIIKTLDGSVESMELHRFILALEKTAKVPFRLTVMVENGPVLTFSIEPRA